MPRKKARREGAGRGDGRAATKGPRKARAKVPAQWKRWLELYALAEALVALEAKRQVPATLEMLSAKSGLSLAATKRWVQGMGQAQYRWFLDHGLGENEYLRE